MAASRTVESTGAANHGERVWGSGANWTMPQRPALVLPKAAHPNRLSSPEEQFPSRPVPLWGLEPDISGSTQLTV